jgi:hypothetical protein
VLGQPLWRWQTELAIRGLELRADGRGYRFSQVTAIVGCQNGNSYSLQAIMLWRLFHRGDRLILGTAQSMQVAKHLWRELTLVAC